MSTDISKIFEFEILGVTNSHAVCTMGKGCANRAVPVMQLLPRKASGVRKQSKDTLIFLFTCTLMVVYVRERHLTLIKALGRSSLAPSSIFQDL